MGERGRCRSFQMPLHGQISLSEQFSTTASLKNATQQLPRKKKQMKFSFVEGIDGLFHLPSDQTELSTYEQRVSFPPSQSFPSLKLAIRFFRKTLLCCLMSVHLTVLRRLRNALKDLRSFIQLQKALRSETLR